MGVLAWALWVIILFKVFRGMMDSLSYPPSTRSWVLGNPDAIQGTCAMVWTWMFFQGKPYTGEMILVNNEYREIIAVERHKTVFLKVHWLIHWEGNQEDDPTEDEEEDEEYEEFSEVA